MRHNNTLPSCVEPFRTREAAHDCENLQQAARGCDIVQLADALGLERPILGGFDWGGNASCVTAALWPERIGGLVSYAGYDVIDVSRERSPVAPSLERVFWYQHLFQTERGRECLTVYRRELCRMLWSEWSPGWQFDEEMFARSAVAFQNPDFVDVVIHCYRWVFGLEPGDPALQALEDHLAQKPTVKVPMVTIDGSTDPHNSRIRLCVKPANLQSVSPRGKCDFVGQKSAKSRT